MSATHTFVHRFPPPPILNHSNHEFDDESSHESDNEFYDESECESAPSLKWDRTRTLLPSARTTFTRRAKSLVSQRCNIDICWLCEAPGAHYCRIIAQAEDPVSTETQPLKMLTFKSFGDYRNIIVLCPNCRALFNVRKTPHPTWLFLPTDLNYFLEYERADYAQRLALLRSNGQWQPRRYPDELEYEKHARDLCQLEEPDDGMCRGGLYDRHILASMFPPGLMIVFREHHGVHEFPFILPGGPKRWHGAPMAAINRGFAAMSSIHRLPAGILRILRELQCLYADHDTMLDAGAIGTQSRRLGNVQFSSGQAQIDEIAVPEPDRQTASSAKQQQQQREHDERNNQEHGNQEHEEHVTYEQQRTDDAIDLTSANPEFTKSTWTPEDASQVSDSTHSSETKKQRNREPVSGLGVSADIWCFGPRSTSMDKARIWCPQLET